MSSPFSWSKPSSLSPEAVLRDWLIHIPHKMVLRRSLIGSLRSVSSFVISPGASANKAEHSPNIRPTGSQSRLSHLASKEEPLLQPELDRDVSMNCSSGFKVDHGQIFEQCLSRDINVYRGHYFFYLPPQIRRHVYDYCFPVESKPISLSPTFATRDAYDSTAFACPWEVLGNVCGGLESFRALRQELLVYFWTQYHFHVTITPFDGPIFSPLSQSWLPPYLPIIQHLTLEVDFTKFGGGLHEDAAIYGFYMESTDRILSDMMIALAQRKGNTTMIELNLICRRYAGFRPVEHEKCEGPFGNIALVPYCSELATLICDSICMIHGLVHQCRISGFTQEYTEMLMRSLFSSNGESVSALITKSSAWSSVLTLNDDSTHVEPLISPSPTQASASPSPPNPYLSASISPTLSKPSSIRHILSPPRQRLLTSSCPQTPTYPNTPGTPSPYPLLLRSFSKTFSTAPSTPSNLSFQHSVLQPFSGLPSSSIPTTPFLGPYTTLSAVSPMKYNLKLNRSRSFQEEIEEELLKSIHDTRLELETSFTTDPDKLDTTTMEAIHDIQQGEDIIEHAMKRSSSEVFVLKGHEIISSSIPTNTLDTNNIPTQTSLAIFTTPRSIRISQSESLQSPKMSRIPRPLGGLTPTRQQRHTLPKSPNTMNKLNEQDPAFQRTLSAMRGIKSPPDLVTTPVRSFSFPTTPQSKSPSAGVERCVTSLNARSNSTKKRYIPFLNRLRGRVE